MTLHRQLLLALVAVSSVAVPPTDAQEASFEEFERVGVVELTVAIERQSGWQFDRPPPTVTPGELVLRVDGVEVPVSSIDSPVSDGVEWQLLVYFDLALSSPELVRSSAELLGAAAENLTTLGAVEVVVAGPEPRRLLAAPSNPALVDEALSGLLREPGAGDRLMTIRSGLCQAGELMADEKRELAG